jgi:Trk K+ transport system NAD-binding subunit
MVFFVVFTSVLLQGTSVRDEVLVPRGTTQIESHDTLLVLAERPGLDRIRAIISGSATPDPRSTSPGPS